MNLQDLPAIFDPTVEEDVRDVFTEKQYARPIVDLMNALSVAEDLMLNEPWMAPARELRAKMFDEWSLL